MAKHLPINRKNAIKWGTWQIAGVLWWKSAMVKVLHHPGLSAMTIGYADVTQTARAQSKRSARAAIAATLDAVVRTMTIWF